MSNCFDPVDGAKCEVCLRQHEEPLQVTSQGPTCEDCIEWVHECDAIELRDRARKTSCRACGSLLRNNVQCEACRVHLRNKGLQNLLETVLTSRVINP